MKDQLAELLLAKVMEWDAPDVAEERPYLQAIAAYKYDEYEQFSPGMRFVERLALWLRQFRTITERHEAYKFVKHRLLYVSRAEMDHLVSTVYPDIVRSIILDEAVRAGGLPEHRLTANARSTEFRVLQRQSLFLGLSDGAHTDVFRRATNEVRHDQVYQTYEISDKRADAMLHELTKDLRHLLRRDPTPEERCFKMVFLLDDFSGSGITYLRQSDDGFAGKINALYMEAGKGDSPLAKLVDITQARLHLILYICTAQAVKHLEKHLQQLWAPSSQPPRVIAVHQLNDDVLISRQSDAAFCGLCDDDDYYDADHLEDEHTRRGGGNVRYGFGDCHLPLILAHNTPNNSVSLLWAHEACDKFRGLFPRVPRHREF